MQSNVITFKMQKYNRLINKKKKLNDFIYSIKEMKKNKKPSFDYLSAKKKELSLYRIIKMK